MSDLTFGVFVPQGWKMELASIADPQAKWQRAVDTAVRAEELGYDTVWVYDHFHNVPVPAHEAMFECWTTIAAISQRTSRIRLGQMVGCTRYRNPALLAKITSTVDVISGGRLDWGIGAGLVRGRVPGLRLRLPLGRHPHRDARRLRRDREAHVDRSRRHLRGHALLGRRRAVRPEAAPGPPPADLDRWRAASARRSGSSRPTPPTRTSAASPTSGPTSATCCAATARRSGRDPEEITMTWSPEVFIRETEAEVGTTTRSFWGEPFESWSAGNLVGTPEQVAEQIRTYVDLGCRGFVPWCSDYPDHETMELLATKVIPELR